MSQAPQKLVIQPAGYPIQLLLSNSPIDMVFYAGNYSTNQETYKIVFSGNGLDVTLPGEFTQPVLFNGMETKQISVNLKPTKSGIVALSVNYSSYERKVYKELVWQVKNQISPKEIEKIQNSSLIASESLQKYAQFTTNIDLISENLTPLSLEHANAAVGMLYQSGKSRIEIDAELVKIIKGVFNTNHNKAVELLVSISDSKIKDDLIRILIAPLILRDQQAGAGLLFSISNESIKNACIELASKVLFYKNPQDAIMLTMNISDAKLKDKVLVDLIFELKNKDSDLAMNVVFQISDESLQKKVLFEIIKSLSQINKAKAVESLSSLVMNTLAGPNIDFIKNCLIYLGYLTSPQSVLDLIEKLDVSQRDFLNEQLKVVLKVQVEEEKTKIEETPIGSLYYEFIAYSGDVTQDLVYLSKLMGNIDPGLLTGNINSSFVILQCYSLQFPLLFSLFNENKQLITSGKPGFHYILYPSVQGLSNEEWTAFVNVLNKFLLPANFQNTSERKGILILLDCIGFTDKPLVILSQSPISQTFVQKLQRGFRDSCIVEINDDFFGMGQLNQEILKITQNRSILPINITLSLNFFNDMSLLHTFFNTLVE
jgi:hypothetical protein